MHVLALVGDVEDRGRALRALPALQSLDQIHDQTGGGDGQQL